MFFLCTGLDSAGLEEIYPLGSCSAQPDSSFLEALMLFFKADILCPQVTWGHEGLKGAKEKVTVDLQDHLDCQVRKKPTY